MRSRKLIAVLAVLTLVVVLTSMAATASAASKYYIVVDLTNQIVTVYDSGNVSESGIVRQMICTTGKSGTPTPTGTFYLPSKSRASERSEWYYFSKYKCYAKWATRIRGGILFHSVLYSASKKGPTRASVNALGSRASHGCVRLRVDDAKWIAKNCLAGTKCKIYSSGKTNSTLRKKLKSKTFSRASQTYDSFMGRTGGSSSASTDSKLPLQSGSKGALVNQLQTRLVELGFLNTTPDGKFGANTLTAVQAFQAASGIKKTSKVDQALWDRIFAADAPTGMVTTLSVGSRGPAVKAMQANLDALLLLQGRVDGVFGSVTEQAVRAFRRNYGYVDAGTANTKLQKAIASKAAELRRQYGDGGYEIASVPRKVRMARVNVRSTLNLRKTASTTSAVLARLGSGTEVKVLEEGKTWIKVVYGQHTGYLHRRYLTFFDGTEYQSEYVAVEADPTPTPTPEISLPTPTPEADPTPTPEVSLPTPTPEISLPTPTPTPEVTPTPSPTPTPEASGTQYAVVLKSGTKAYSKPEVSDKTDMATVAAKRSFEVLSVVGDWVKVDFDGLSGYFRLSDVELTNTRPDGSGGISAAPEAGEGAKPVPGYAVVLLDGTRLYAAPVAEDDRVIAVLDEGAALGVIEISADWIYVVFDGQEGFIPAMDVELTDDLPGEPSALEAQWVFGAEPTPVPADEPEGGLVFDNGLTIEPEAVAASTVPGDMDEVAAEPVEALAE